MVKVTIYVEGSPGIIAENPDALTVDNSSALREAFHKLFSNGLSAELFDLAVQPFGSVTQAKSHLKKITDDRLNSVILLDLDGEKSSRAQRINDNYADYDISKIFFMVQEMEAWIISQIEICDAYAAEVGLITKQVTRRLRENPLLNVEHPEMISKPSEKLDTILSQHYHEKRVRKGQFKLSPKRYSKTKDAPILIGFLKMDLLRATFDEVANLLKHIEDSKQE